MVEYRARVLSDAQIERINNTTYIDGEDFFELFMDMCDLGHTAKAERKLATEALEQLRLANVRLTRQAKDYKAATDRLSRALNFACEQLVKLWKGPSGLSRQGWVDLFVVKAAVADINEKKAAKYMNEVRFTIFPY